MMERTNLARQIRDRAYLTGDFLLRSGQRSSFYWDKYRFESEPILLAAIAEELRKLLPASFDKLAGLELGGIPLATVLSGQTAKPCLFIRKAAKDYGTSNLVEGGFQTGEKAVVVEDIVTSGGQIVASIHEMRNLGLEVHHAVCVVDRQQGGTEALARIGCTLSAVFTLTEIERLAAI